MTHLLYLTALLLVGLYCEGRGYRRGVKDGIRTASWKPKESHLRHTVMMERCTCGGVKPVELAEPTFNTNDTVFPVESTTKIYISSEPSPSTL